MAEDVEKTAIEQAARAVYEHGRGHGAWSKAQTDDRSNARQAVRLALAAFKKNGFELHYKPNAPKVIKVAQPLRPGAARF